MTKVMKIKVAGGLLFGVLSVLGAGHAAASPVKQRYACDGRQNLVIWRSADVATVQFIDRTYVLQRRSSSIGEKYIAPTSALIIDGPSAVFVADDRLQLGRCVETSSLASTR
jgi:hypothetical protein